MILPPDRSPRRSVTAFGREHVFQAGRRRRRRRKRSPWWQQVCPRRTAVAVARLRRYASTVSSRTLGGGWGRGEGAASTCEQINAVVSFRVHGGTRRTVQLHRRAPSASLSRNSICHFARACVGERVHDDNALAPTAVVTVSRPKVDVARRRRKEFR